MKKISLFLLITFCCLVSSFVLFGIRRPFNWNYGANNNKVLIQAEDAEEKETADEKKDEKKEKEKSAADRVLEGITKELKKYWDAFNWENFKELVQKRYKSQFQQLGEVKASVTKGVKVDSMGELDSGTTKEGRFIVDRIRVAQEALEPYTGLNFYSTEEIPRIACAFSGGGYRAMITTAGFLKGLEDIGLLDAVMNISTLSGSTWYLGPWTFLQNPATGAKVTANEFSMMLLDKIKNDKFNLLSVKGAKNFDVEDYIEGVFWPKIIFDKIFSSVDIYGAMLAHYLLADCPGKRMNLRLSNQWFNVREGNHPWPSYTAVSMHKANGGYLYNWYEFNPEEVRNLEYNLAIPAYSFGRKFENGEAVDLPPRESFGFLMGIFGSAYTVNLKDIIRIMFGGIPKEDSDIEQLIATWYKKPVSWAKKGLSTLKDIGELAVQFKFKEIWEKTSPFLDQVQAAVFARVLAMIADAPQFEVLGVKVRLGTARVAPAQINNPFKGYEGAQAWLKARDNLTLVDGGINYNIPVRPLFRPERQIDLIIIGDASGNVPKEGSADLALALKDVKRFYGIEYTKDALLSSKTIEIYRPNQKTYPRVDEVFKKVVPPTIVYFNFLKDDTLIDRQEDPELQRLIYENDLKNFDPRKCLEGFCGTFNFDYTQDEFKQLSGIAEFNIKVHNLAIKALIAERAELRQEKPEFGF